MTEIEELKRIIEILDQEGVEKCEKLEKQAKQIKQLEKALDKACELLESLTEDGQILCPCEYLGICHCESTESGYECDGDVDYKWRYALLKEVKEYE